MLDIPFFLETIPSRDADQALARLSREQPTRIPVLLGDADVFSTEWAESVDKFEPPEEVLAAAREIDIDAWFEGRKAWNSETAAKMRGTFPPRVAFPRDILLMPFRLMTWPLTGRRPALFSRSGSELAPTETDPMFEMLKSQLAELEAAGEGTEEELEDIRQVIASIEAEGDTVFPDPVAYVTPRHGQTLAAGMVEAREPWEAAAWLQHGTYAICAPKPLVVALCKWLWETHGGRIITASVDSIGFQMDRPIATAEEAEEVLRRFSVLGASEVNADHSGSAGTSLIDAPRLWVWWD